MKSPIPLKAYLASALTGLDPQQEKEIFEVQEIIAHVCSAHGIEPYQPRKISHPTMHKDLLPPTVWHMDHDRVLASDLLILLAHEPSFGAGEEAEFARNALLPIIVIFPEGRPVSRMVLGMPATVLTVGYGSKEDLQRNFTRTIRLLVPILFDRKMAFGNSDEIILGQKVRQLREQNHISEQALAETLGVGVEEIRHLEEKPDRASNPSLLMLRKLATVLKVSVAELIVPDYTGIVAQQVVQLLQEKVAVGGARDLTQMPPADRRRFWRRVMERAIQEIGRE